MDHARNTGHLLIRQLSDETGLTCLNGHAALGFARGIDD